MNTHEENVVSDYESDNGVDSDFMTSDQEPDNDDNENLIVSDTEDEYESMEDQANSSEDNLENISINNVDTTIQHVETFVSQSIPSNEIDQAFDDISDKHNLSPKGLESTRGGLPYRGGRTGRRGKGIPSMHQRQDLWDDIKNFATVNSSPWIVIGDFNSIITPEEKKGGNAHNISKSMPFINCILDSGLLDMGFTGSPYTWCNGRAPKRRIWARLDRALANSEWIQSFSESSVEHLVRTGSDHAPMLISTSNSLREPKKYFRFLDFWTEQEGFMQVVEDAWVIHVEGSPMWKFHLKLKNVCKSLSHWSRNTIGNIFEKTKELQSKLEMLEQNCLTNNSEANRMEYNCTNALLIRHIKKEESFWRQKAGLKWFNDGDNNIKFFHSVINSRRKKLHLSRIKKQDGSWLDNTDDIAAEAILFFEQQFSQETTCRDYFILRRLSRVVDEYDNKMLTELPNMEELKEVVFSMSSVSSPGPDGISGKFFQFCWNIISSDLLMVILDFFAGNELPRAFTHTNLVLIPKVDNPQEFTDFRPISLSNFISKIISKLLNNRLSKIMNKIISPNQSGFLKGRSISDNVMLTQELVHNLNRKNVNGNVVFKLDMAKAFDRVA
ncbi:hypothetical protein KY290_010184 [Solanum tuberosum]|uniref:Reverse transcriptase domain-containing protein n=1 Tax=Solanum tuberosum TaxID=4113 RepID=A0ABQ7VX37_SOLTU|nr:hypothetical protein KY290_010184 [Solanum tuberosum]